MLKRSAWTLKMEIPALFQMNRSPRLMIGQQKNWLTKTSGFAVNNIDWGGILRNRSDCSPKIFGRRSLPPFHFEHSAKNQSDERFETVVDLEMFIG